MGGETAAAVATLVAVGLSAVMVRRRGKREIRGRRKRRSKTNKGKQKKENKNVSEK